MPPKKKVIDQVSETKSKDKKNLEILSRIEACPYCGSGISHMGRFGLYWQCNICKNTFVRRQKI